MAEPLFMNVDEYFLTLETKLPAELRYGVLHVAESPRPRHQSAVASLFLALNAHVRRRGIGTVWLSPLDVVLNYEHALIVQPDLMFISKDNERIVQDRVRGAPDLIIEVLSPNARIGNVEERVVWFARFGVRECWLVHLDRRDATIITFANRQIATRVVFAPRRSIASTVLPDFTETLDDILEPEHR